MKLTMFYQRFDQNLFSCSFCQFLTTSLFELCKTNVVEGHKWLTTTSHDLGELFYIYDSL